MSFYKPLPDARAQVKVTTEGDLISLTQEGQQVLDALPEATNIYDFEEKFKLVYGFYPVTMHEGRA